LKFRMQRLDHADIFSHWALLFSLQNDLIPTN